MTVGERIKQKREEKGLSQEDLAIKMGFKDRSSISKIEKYSDKNITVETVQKAAEALGCSPLELMGWNTDETKQQKIRENIFEKIYNDLNEDQQKLIDNMLTALSSR